MPRYAKEINNHPYPYAPKPRGPYSRTGIYGLKRVLKKVGLAAIDGRSSGGQQILGERRQWIADCGGVDNLTSMELTIINSATITNLLLGVVDSWIIEHQGQLIRKRSLIPVISQRLQLVNSLNQSLAMIGLSRRAKPVRTLADLAAEIESSHHDGNNGHRGAGFDAPGDVPAGNGGDPNPATSKVVAQNCATSMSKVASSLTAQNCAVSQTDTSNNLPADLKSGSTDSGIVCQTVTQDGDEG